MSDTGLKIIDILDIAAIFTDGVICASLIIITSLYVVMMRRARKREKENDKKWAEMRAKMAENSQKLHEAMMANAAKDSPELYTPKSAPH